MVMYLVLVQLVVVYFAGRRRNLALGQPTQQRESAWSWGVVCSGVVCGSVVCGGVFCGGVFCGGGVFCRSASEPCPRPARPAAKLSLVVVG